MPMAVKKLMLKRVFRGLSVGNMAVRCGCKSGSVIRSCSFFIPIDCDRSSKRILMNMRDEDVVSSSLRWMACMTFQPIASDDSMCPKN